MNENLLQKQRDSVKNNTRGRESRTKNLKPSELEKRVRASIPQKFEGLLMK